MRSGGESAEFNHGRETVRHDNGIAEDWQIREKHDR